MKSGDRCSLEKARIDVVGKAVPWLGGSLKVAFIHLSIVVTYDSIARSLENWSRPSESSSMVGVRMVLKPHLYL